MRSAFVDRVVVGILAREQISLRSATFRVFLRSVRKRKERKENVINAQLCLHFVEMDGREGRCT